jgi:CheY-like chemotaxis protein
MLIERAIPTHSFLAPRLRVLCVDDAELALECRAQILEMSGYDVTTSASPVRAAQTFASANFDLAVLDYDMPVINGDQLAAWLKSDNPELKIILFTGAAWVPEHELHFVDLMVPKSEGVPALLAALETLLPFCPSNADQREHMADA